MLLLPTQLAPVALPEAPVESPLPTTTDTSGFAALLESLLSGAANSEVPAEQSDTTEPVPADHAVAETLVDVPVAPVLMVNIQAPTPDLPAAASTPAPMTDTGASITAQTSAPLDALGVELPLDAVTATPTPDPGNGTPSSPDAATTTADPASLLTNATEPSAPAPSPAPLPHTTAPQPTTTTTTAPVEVSPVLTPVPPATPRPEAPDGDTPAAQTTTTDVAASPLVATTPAPAQTTPAPAPPVTQAAPPTASPTEVLAEAIREATAELSSTQGETTLNFTVTDATLGEVAVELTMSDQRLKVAFASTQAATAAELSSALDTLRTQLSSQLSTQVDIDVHHRAPDAHEVHEMSRRHPASGGTSEAGTSVLDAHREMRTRLAAAALNAVPTTTGFSPLDLTL